MNQNIEYNTVRIDRILNHELYVRCMDTIEHAEEDRIYCLHNLAHSLDVARIAYIMNLEEEYHLSRELIYAMALLHDLGRSTQYMTGESHHTAGVSIARTILTECGFTEEETEQLCQAIGAHQNPVEEKTNRYVTVLYNADKLSRICFDCKARKTCYWKEEERNYTIKY